MTTRILTMKIVIPPIIKKVYQPFQITKRKIVHRFLKYIEMKQKGNVSSSAVGLLALRYPFVAQKGRFCNWEVRAGCRFRLIFQRVS